MHRVRQPWFWALIFILAVALWLRLGSIRFGLPALHDPDELMFELGAFRMLREPTLNPGWFGHPATTTMYVLAIVNVGVFVTGWIAGWFGSAKELADLIYADPSWVILPGRIAMTLFALGTLILTARLGSRLIDRRAGLIAATLLAISPVHISWSQIIRSDMMACFFLLLCLLSALNIADRNRWRDYVLASLWLGLAVATKWPFALAGLGVGGAVVLLVAQRRMGVGQAVGRLARFGALAALFLCLISPYLLLDYPTVLRNLTGEGQLRHLGSTGGTTFQNALWYLRGPLTSGLSIVGLILVPVGAVSLRGNPRALAILGPVILCYFALLCLQSMVWERWALPLLPLCAIIIAAVITKLADRMRRRWRPVAILLLAIAIAPPLLLRAQGDARERMNDTRQAASQWARTHFPPGSSVLIEHFAFDLIGQPWHFLFPIGEAGCVDARAMLRGKTSYTPIDRARGPRSNVDYGTMAPARRAACRPDFAILTQYDRYRREARAFPAEYAAYQHLLAGGRIVATFDPQPGRVGGRRVTIVAFARR